MPRLPATVARRGDGQPIAQFAYEYCRHSKGRWAGQPVLFEPFQRDFFDEAFRIGPDGRRMYQEVVYGLPRKNGKSTTASVFGLYMLGFDGEGGPEVYAAAAAQKQAGIVFGASRSMLTRSPDLQRWFKLRQYEIQSPDNDGIYRVLSADAPLQHGLNPSANIIDEYWAHRTPDLYEALTSGSGAREQPLTLTITTAGWDLNTPLGQLFTRALVVPEVERRGALTIARDVENGFLLWWYGADEDADLENPRVWAACNPASWITAEYLKRERSKPSMRPEAFYQLHLNHWVRVMGGFLPVGAWSKCRVDQMACTDRPACVQGTCLNGFRSDLPATVAIDVALKGDSTAVTLAQRQGDRTRTRTRIWSNPYPPNHSEHAYWQTPLDDVMDHLRWLRREFPVPAAEIDGEVRPGPRFAFDPAYFGNEARELAGEGLAMEPYSQTDSRMIPASETLYRLVIDRAVEHDGDGLVAHHIGNAIMEPKGHGRWRLSRPRGSNVKIDAAISNAIAVHLAQQPAPEPPRPRSRALRSR